MQQCRTKILQLCQPQPCAESRCSSVSSPDPVRAYRITDKLVKWKPLLKNPPPYRGRVKRNVMDLCAWSFIKSLQNTYQRTPRPLSWHPNACAIPRAWRGSRHSGTCQGEFEQFGTRNAYHKSERSLCSCSDSLGDLFAPEDSKGRDPAGVHESIIWCHHW